MTTTLRAIRAGLLVPLALLLAGAAPAAHATPGYGMPGNWLRLAVTHGDARTGATRAGAIRARDARGGDARARDARARDARAGDARGVLLLCDPPRGHAHAALACRQLVAAGGDIGRIPRRSGAMCPMLYAPVTASAYGVWDGRRVDYTHTFSNSCVMGAGTGAVFDLAR
ncbi:SSI family serine proteinase inhibitor [Streptomyces sp. SAS_267]|uniref:SSI family serine proteinase inhibitor n=1 Tax=unclassified Streptomyces TaxID=2593676 RepID=UPI0036F73324